MPPQEMIVGDNWLAIIVAAIAFYAIGFLIYGAVFSKLWMQLSGYTQEQLKPHMWKMAVSPLMPRCAASQTSPQGSSSPSRSGSS
jgi:hypothetical protein